MTRYVALLRGINVGGNRSVSMPDLRHVFELTGCADVSTYIQSGNVLFTTDNPPRGDDLEAALADRFGLRISVIIRTSEDLQAVVAACPLPATNTKAVHVGFMAQAPDAVILRGLDLTKFAPDTAAVHGTEIYFHLPNGMARSKLPGCLDRSLGVPMTIRNWNTTRRLHELTL